MLASAQVEGLKLGNQGFSFTTQHLSLLDDPVLSTAFAMSLKTTSHVGARFLVQGVGCVFASVFGLAMNAAGGGMVPQAGGVVIGP